MAQGKEITYYDETYIVPDTVIAEIADKGIRTRYESQCNNCIAFMITDEEKAANAELWSWCIVKCWKCKEVYKHTLLQGVAQETAERVRQEVEERAAERVQELERELERVHQESMSKIAELEQELEDMGKEKGIAKDKRNKGKNFVLFERKWYILLEVLYKRAAPSKLGKVSQSSRAKLYRVGCALIYAAIKMDKAVYDTTAQAEGISRETAEQVYSYIQQNPPSDDILRRAEKKGINALSVD